MQKRADLHRHLDGSLRESSFRELALKEGIQLPEDIYFKPHMSLDQALSFFEYSLSVLQCKENISRVAGEVCEDAKKDGVKHLEIRFGPHLHQKKGLKLEEIIDAALEGIEERAGLILCGLYGDPPELLENFVELARTRKDIVGLDLAGGPHGSQEFILEDYESAFKKAAEMGLGRTVHAGEGRSPEEIIIAINKLEAQRIGHGVTLLESEEALGLVLDKKITIEACPTSNLQCGVIPSYEHHPLGKWLELGVKVCLNTDNTFFSQISSSQEHEKALSIKLMDDSKLNQAIENGLNAGFKRV